jgi:hypothetical protein
LKSTEEVFDRYEHAIVLDAMRDDSAAVEAEISGFKATMESVDLLREVILLERDVPAQIQSDALRLGRHPFCDGAEGFVLDDTS